MARSLSSMVSQNTSVYVSWTHRVSQHMMWASQEALWLGLNQREIGSTQHGLRSLQGLCLTSASLLAYIKILQKPITLGMQRRDVCRGCHQVFAFGNLARLMRLQCCLCICFAGAL